MKTNRLLLLVLALSLPCLAVACGDDDDDGAGQQDASTGVDAGQPDATTAASVKVKAGSKTATVDLSKLSTSKINGKDVVLVSAVIDASGLTVDLAESTLDFEGSDGYRPSQKDFCADMLPTAGTNANKVGIDLADENTLVWDSALNMSNCAAVNDVAIIYVARAAEMDAAVPDSGGPDAAEPADDAGSAANQVRVKYGSDEEEVTLDGLSTDSIDGTDVVLVSTIIDESGLSVTLADVTVDFEGGDGYRPSTKSNCSSFLPADGFNADKVGVDPADENTLVWDSSLSAPGCAGVSDVAIIYIEDK